MDDKRIRQLVIAVLAVVLVLGLLNIISTAFSLLVPLALLTAGAFAFYKIVLEGRDQSAATADELVEGSGAVSEAMISGAESAGDAADDQEAAAQKRLSAVDRARGEFLETTTPAEEILDQIRSRRQRLAGDDDA